MEVVLRGLEAKKIRDPNLDSKYESFFMTKGVKIFS